MLSTSVPPPHLSLSDTKCSSKAVYKIFCWPSKSCNSLQTVIKCQPLSGAWLTSLRKTQISSAPTPIFLAKNVFTPSPGPKNSPSSPFFSDLSPKSLIRQSSLWDMCVCEWWGGGVPDILTRLFWPAGPHTHISYTRRVESPLKAPFLSQKHMLFEGLTHSSYAMGLPLSQAQRNAGPLDTHGFSSLPSSGPLSSLHIFSEHYSTQHSSVRVPRRTTSWTSISFP